MGQTRLSCAVDLGKLTTQHLEQFDPRLGSLKTHIRGLVGKSSSFVQALVHSGKRDWSENWVGKITSNRLETNIKSTHWESECKPGSIPMSIYGS